MITNVVVSSERQWMNGGIPSGTVGGPAHGLSLSVALSLTHTYTDTDTDTRTHTHHKLGFAGASADLLVHFFPAQKN